MIWAEHDTRRPIWNFKTNLKEKPSVPYTGAYDELLSKDFNNYEQTLLVTLTGYSVTTTCNLKN